MVPTLRTLCLLEVSSLPPGYKDVPSELINDMLKMKAFNGSYSLFSEEKVFLSKLSSPSFTTEHPGHSSQCASASHSSAALIVMPQVQKCTQSPSQKESKFQSSQPLVRL